MKWGKREKKEGELQTKCSTLKDPKVFTRVFFFQLLARLLQQCGDIRHNRHWILIVIIRLDGHTVFSDQILTKVPLHVTGNHRLQVLVDGIVVGTTQRRIRQTLRDIARAPRGIDIEFGKKRKIGAFGLRKFQNVCVRVRFLVHELITWKSQNRESFGTKVTHQPWELFVVYCGLASVRCNIYNQSDLALKVTHILWQTINVNCLQVVQ